jgi:branched-chain amino acid transport system permease protein
MRGPGPRRPGGRRPGGRHAHSRSAALRRYRGLAVLALMLAALPWTLPNNFYFNVAILAGLNAIVCVGLNLLIGYAGQISLGHAGFFGLGAYSSAILTVTYGWPAWAGLLAGLAIVGLLAFLLARPILRLRGHYLAMATLGMGIIISIVLVQETRLTGGPDGMQLPPVQIAGFELYSERVWYWIVAAALLLAVWLALNLVDSPAGRALRALHGSEVAAASLGIDTARFATIAFVVSALFAAAAGSLFAHYSGFLTPGEAGFLRSIEFVTMVVFGGMASIFGAVAGAAILTVLPQLLTLFHDYEHVMLGLILMGTMVLMPKGLVPTLAGLARRRRP